MLYTEQFNYDHITGVFSQEISTLGHDDIWERLYPDAADIGIRLQSSKTGVVAEYYRAETCTRDGDITHWVCLPVPSMKQRSNMSLMRTKVIVFND